MKKEDTTPFVPATETLAEVTPQSVILGVVLSVLLAAANVYLGLYAGMTVAASIPAAVVSMALLRGLLRRGTILENNIVSTIASSGQALASGVIFTVPAMLIAGVWDDIHFWPTTLICMTGGLLGIIFMVPLRRALIVEDSTLSYPEGRACAEVLIAGEKGGGSAKHVALAAILGACFKFLTSAVSVFKATVEWVLPMGASGAYFGFNVSPALLGVGYIVGIRIALIVFAGGVTSWLIAVPLVVGQTTLEPDLLGLFWKIWKNEVRFLGVGAMVVGGLWSMFHVRHGISSAIKEAVQKRGRSASVKALRTDRDMAYTDLGTLLVTAVVVVFFLYRHLTHSTNISLLATAVMVVMAFFFVAVSTYIVGLVGTSNSPVSGMTICAVLATGGLLIALGMTGPEGIIATLGVAGVVCCAACAAGDASQDLKCGYILGATPKAQQWMEVVGTVVPAFVMAPVLVVLHHAYGIGTGHPDSLKAPQATLFASLVKGLFGHGTLPWSFVGIGALIGVAVILIDQTLAARKVKFRLPVMAVAVGMYLPFTLSVPMVLGGLIGAFSTNREEAGPGLLFASGLVAGEALVGILIGAVIYFNRSAFPIPVLQSDLVSVVGMLGLGLTLLWVGRKVVPGARTPS